jgi:hypothetical protein
MSNANRKRRKVNENSTKSELTQPDTENSTDTSCPSNIEKRDSGKTSPTNISDTTETKVKYVEAPIPKVNPWKKNEIQTDAKDINDCKTNISDDYVYEHTDVHDKPIDGSAPTKEIIDVLHSSKINQQEGNNKQPASSITAKITTAPEDKVSVNVTAANPAQDMNASSQYKGEVNSNALQALPGTTAWRSTADTMSKLAPIKDEKVSSPSFGQI